MPREVIKDLVMPGGWNFLQKMPDGSEFEIRTSGYDELPTAVLNFRLQNRLEIGQPETEVPEQICERYPRQCPTGRNDMSITRPPQPPGPMRFVDHLIIWGQSLQGNISTQTLEPPGDALKRAQVCRGCPMNVEWEHSCPTCVDHAKRLFALLRKGKDEQPGIHACKLLKHDNNTAIWLKKEVLQRGPMEQLPTQCWVK